MAIAYSLHISSNKNALSTTTKVSGASKHNLRKYKSDDYDPNGIVTYVGSDNILNDVKKAYHELFDDAVKEYNKGKKPYRQIKNYLKHVSEKATNDVAVEMIIQLGDMEFWADKTIEERKQMSYIFKDQIKYLQEILPDFKIVNAVGHFDEASPHMHIVGIPVHRGYTKGMEVQCAKTKVFTQETLTMLQDKMRARASIGMGYNTNVFGSGEEKETIKEKEKGRNTQYSKDFFIRKKQAEYEELCNKLEEEKKIHKDELDKLEMEKGILDQNITFLGNQILSKQNYLEELELRFNKSKNELSGLCNEINSFKHKLSLIVEEVKLKRVLLTETIEKQNKAKNELDITESKLEEVKKCLFETGELVEQETSKVEEIRKEREELENLPPIEKEINYKERYLAFDEDIKGLVNTIDNLSPEAYEEVMEKLPEEISNTYFPVKGYFKPFS